MDLPPPRGLIVVLTGAGISVDSGLPSFRGAGGLWEGRRLEEVATPEAFARDPATVQRFYDGRRRQLQARATTIEINLEPSALGSSFAQCRRGRASELVPELVAELLAGRV